MWRIILAQRERKRKRERLRKTVLKISYYSAYCSSRYVVNFSSSNVHVPRARCLLAVLFAVLIFCRVCGRATATHRRPICVNEGHGDHRCSWFDWKNFPSLYIIGWKYASARNDVGKGFRRRSIVFATTVGSHQERAFSGKKKEKEKTEVFDQTADKGRFGNDNLEIFARIMTACQFERHRWNVEILVPTWTKIWSSFVEATSS